MSVAFYISKWKTQDLWGFCFDGDFFHFIKIIFTTLPLVIHRLEFPFNIFPFSIFNLHNRLKCIWAERHAANTINEKTNRIDDTIIIENVLCKQLFPFWFIDTLSHNTQIIFLLETSVGWSHNSIGAPHMYKFKIKMNSPKCAYNLNYVLLVLPNCSSKFKCLSLQNAIITQHICCINKRMTHKIISFTRRNDVAFSLSLLPFIERSII